MPAFSTPAAHRYQRRELADKPREVLVDLYREIGENLLRSRDTCHNLLRDLCGEFRPETFALASVAREGLLVNFASNGGARAILRRLTDQIKTQLGFSDEVALWAAESWALACDWITPSDVRRRFACPTCSLSGRSRVEWAQRTVVCPSCKSRISFDTDVNIIGTVTDTRPQRTTATDTWLVLDADEMVESLAVRQLKRGICHMLDDDNSTSQAKASAIDLRRIVAVLETETRDIIHEIDNEEGVSAVAVYDLLVSVLAAFQFTIPGLVVGDALGDDLLSKVNKTFDISSGDRVVGVIEYPAFDGVSREIVFTTQAIHYSNANDAERAGVGAFRLEVLGRLDCTPTGLHTIALGDTGEVLDLRGSGIGKTDMLEMIRVIKSVVVTRK